MSSDTKVGPLLTGLKSQDILENQFNMGKQMTTVSVKESLGAPITRNLRWDAIDWQEAEVQVNRLQNRIAKAYREGRHNKVKSLQWLLTHSLNY